MSIPVRFRKMFHADWSTGPKKRWVASCSRDSHDVWSVGAPQLVGDTESFVNQLFTSDGPVLAGFDFPIGVPESYGKNTGLKNFVEALEAFGQGEWAEFYSVAEAPGEISRTRPFYPRAPTGSSKQLHLLNGHGVGNIDELRRHCERATASRRAACSMFWTLGGNQVGKAAISGWREVIAPARRRGAQLWPFDGSLAELAANGFPVLAETYPAEAYGHVGVLFKTSMSKRRQEDRRLAMSALPDWAQRHDVILSKDLSAEVENGFGPSGDGEDAFDALIGLLGMIEVVDGRRLELSAIQSDVRLWEGWILGQTA